MKSTLKIDLQGQNPIIKIIRPDEVVKLQETDDYDVKDKLINDFLKNPLYHNNYEWFQIASNFQVEGKQVVLTTIAPVLEETLFERFKCTILSRIVPYNTLVEIEKYKASDPKNGREKGFNREHEAEKIIEFFDWLSKQEYYTDFHDITIIENRIDL